MVSFCLISLKYSWVLPILVKVPENDNYMGQFSIDSSIQNSATKNRTLNSKESVGFAPVARLSTLDKNAVQKAESQNSALGQPKTKEMLTDKVNGGQSNSKLPSYLMPTYSALQLKKQKLELEEKQRFTFAKSKGKKLEYVAWKDKPEDTLPLEKHGKNQLFLVVILGIRAPSSQL